MKNTSILMAALAAISIVGAASASAEVVYVTGSTAFRSSANTAITTFATNNGGHTLAQDNTTLGSAGNLLVNFVVSGTTNLIDVHWSGSEAGIQSVAGPATGSNAAKIGFFATNATGTNSSVGNSTSAQNTNSQVAQLSFSDTYQSTSIFNGTLQGVTYSTLSGFDGSDGIVGVVSFNWIGSKNITASNISQNLANQLLAAGTVPLALLTGSSADKTNGVYLFGRNIDSGTRLTTLSEVGYGARTPVVQYKFDSTSKIEPYPIETIDGISSGTLGNSGYSSGGTLAGLFTNTFAAGTNLAVVSIDGSTTNPSVYTGTNFLVGYAGTSDANGQTNNGLVKMSYDGVASGTNTIIQGQYTFWGYEHLYVSPSADSVATEVATGLGDGILATPTSTLTPNVNYNELNAVVGRNGDGAPVYNQY
jgi:hypothetical protein